MSIPRITLVVGGSRGIGAELVKQLAGASAQDLVIATHRKPQASTQNNVQIVTLDSNSSESVQTAASKIAEIDTLIINAAIGDDELLLSTSDDRMQDYCNTNILGPLRVIRAFLPALRARQTRKIVIISSQSGSLTKQINATGGFRGPYAVTKAACNMIAVQSHNELHGEGFVVVPIHPGWVATEMGNVAGGGGMPVEDSVKGIMKVVDSLKLEDSAKFFAIDGTELPW